jgi:hypothetical protein
MILYIHLSPSFAATVRVLSSACLLFSLATTALVTPNNNVWRRVGVQTARATTTKTTTFTRRHTSYSILLSSNTLETSAAASISNSNNTSSSLSSSSIVEPLAGTWECNEEAECVSVPECSDQECRTSLDVRIHGEWYDLTGTYHPK